jgi:hypothetical protein
MSIQSKKQEDACCDPDSWRAPGYSRLSETTNCAAANPAAAAEASKVLVTFGFGAAILKHMCNTHRVNRFDTHADKRFMAGPRDATRGMSASATASLALALAASFTFTLGTCSIYIELHVIL